MNFCIYILSHQKKLLMKNKSLSISVPEPCHENWSEMSPVEQGRHCLSCQKTVIDFTRMPKVKIAEFVSEQNGSMCGRFSLDQLNVELIPPKPTRSWFKYVAIILGLAPTLGCGQEVSSTKESTQQIISSPITGDIVIKTEEEMQIQQAPTWNKIAGKVIDKATKKAVFAAKIDILNDGNILQTLYADANGNFNADIPEGAYFKVSFLGYQSKILTPEQLKSDNNLQIEIEESPRMMMGIIIPESPNDETQSGEKEERKNHKPSHKINKSITGKLICSQSGEEIIAGTIAVYLHDILQYTVETDLEGKFEIEYQKEARIEASQIGYEPKFINYQNIPADGNFIISLDYGTQEEVEIVTGYYISKKQLDLRKNKKASRQIEKAEYLKVLDYNKELHSVEESNKQDKNTNSEQLPIANDPPLQYLAPPIEISAPKHSTSQMCITGLTVSSTREEEDSWLKRQWKKLKHLVYTSYQETSKKNDPPRLLYETQLNYNADNEDTHAISELENQNSEKGQDDIDQLKINICPNPTSGQVVINIPEQISAYTIHITNIRNELVLVQEELTTSNPVDISHLNAGSYIVSIITEDGLIFSELIVKI